MLPCFEIQNEITMVKWMEPQMCLHIAFKIKHKKLFIGFFYEQQAYRPPLHEECPKHHGHKGDPGVTHGTCGTIGVRAQVVLV